MKLKKDEVLICTGDSITEMGRAMPDGEGLSCNPSWGSSYVNLVGGYLGAEFPELRIRVINQGISGNQSRDLLARWDTDVIAKKPDWVTVLIGVNDVWRKFDAPYLYHLHVELDEYRENLKKIMEKTLPVTQNIIMLTPYMIENNPQDAMRQEMLRFSQVCKEVAAEHQIPCLDLQAGFDKLLETTHPMYYGWDRIHPNIVGQTMISHLLLRYLEAMK